MLFTDASGFIVFAGVLNTEWLALRWDTVSELDHHGYKDYPSNMSYLKYFLYVIFVIKKGGRGIFLFGQPTSMNAHIIVANMHKQTRLQSSGRMRDH